MRSATSCRSGARPEGCSCGGRATRPSVGSRPTRAQRALRPLQPAARSRPGLRGGLRAADPRREPVDRRARRGPRGVPGQRARRDPARPARGSRVSRAARMRPRPEQDLLLRAALLPDPGQAAEAYAQWAARVDLDKLDFGSLQLLPLLAQRPGGVPDDDALARQMRHVARFSWLRTQMLGRRVAPVVAALADAGLEPTAEQGGGAGLRARRRRASATDVRHRRGHRAAGRRPGRRGPQRRSATTRRCRTR